MHTHTLDLRLVAVAVTLAALALPLGARGEQGLGLAQSACLTQIAPTLYGDEPSGGVKACAKGRALLGATGVAVSADGKNVYVASSDSDAVVSFGRSGGLGTLTQLACVSNNGTTGLDGTKGACTDGDALRGANALVESPDGKNVYATSYRSSAIDIFARDPLTGKLTQTGCVRAVNTCTGAGGLGGATGIAISPDGKNAYVVSYNADAVVMFARDEGTGALKGLGCISDDGNDRQCGTGNALRGPNAVVMSKDGRWLYVAASESNSVLTFERDPATGLLTQRGCLLDHAPRNGSCASANALVTPVALSLAPDGRTLFVASYDSNSIAVFARDVTTGKLAQRGCLSDITQAYDEETKDGCVHVAPMGSPMSLTLTADGRRLYVADDVGFTVLERDATTGGLAYVGCATYPGYYDDDVTKTCVIARGISGTAGLALSPDGRNLYVAASSSNALTTFNPGASVFTRRVTKRGLLAVRVSCPVEAESGCAGKLNLLQPRGTKAATQPKTYSVEAGGSLTLFLHVQKALLGKRMKLTLSAGPVMQHVFLGRPLPKKRAR